MISPREAPSSAEVATKVNDVSVGLGILTFALFPFALPGIVLVVAPLVLVVVVGLLVAIPVVLPLWLARSLVRRWSRRRGAARARVTAGPGRGVRSTPDRADETARRGDQDDREQVWGSRGQPIGPSSRRGREREGGVVAAARPCTRT